MKIALAAPLYPPDVAWPAPYIKELARRLSPAHEISIVTYGRLPEKIDGVKIIAVDKRAPLPLRLARYALALWRASAADIIYAENGPSVELPLVVVSFFAKAPIVLHQGDPRAHARAASGALGALGALAGAARSSAKKIVTESPLPRPEILPFATTPDFGAYEASWKAHIEMLEEVFAHAKR